MKTKKMLCAVVMVMMLAIMFTVPAFAAGTGDVAGAIEGTWTDASAQIKTVVNNVVFPVIDLVLAVFFFQQYKRKKQLLFQKFLCRLNEIQKAHFLSSLL